MEGVDYFLEEAAEGLPLAGPPPEINVGVLPRHPAGFGSQVPIGAVKAGHHGVQQQPLQLILVGCLQPGENGANGTYDGSMMRMINASIVFLQLPVTQVRSMHWRGA